MALLSPLETKPKRVVVVLLFSAFLNGPAALESLRQLGREDAANLMQFYVADAFIVAPVFVVT